MTDLNVLEKIKNELIQSKRDIRYKLEAYNFVLQGLRFHHSCIGEIRHIHGTELVRALIELSQKIYGPMAQFILNKWGIFQPSDFGYIIYNLIELKLVFKQETDALEDFFITESIEQLLEKKDPLSIPKNNIRSIKKA